MIPRTTTQLRDIAAGPQGTYATLMLMRALAKQGKTAMPVRALALSLVSGLKQKDYLGEAKRVHAYVRDHIRYVRDVDGVETLHTPEKVIEYGQGDCDDKSILAAALLGAIGHKTRFVAMGFGNKQFSHVYVETRVGNKWVGFETTEPVNFGWHPSGATSRMVVNN